MGAGLNVKINASSLKDQDAAKALISEAEALMAEATKQEAEIMQMVERVISGTDRGKTGKNITNKQQKNPKYYDKRGI